MYKQCEGGTYSTNRSGLCIFCLAGRYAAAGSAQYNYCPAGRASDPWSQDYNSCPARIFSNVRASSVSAEGSSKNRGAKGAIAVYLLRWAALSAVFVPLVVR